MKVVGHRGAAGLAPENTLKSLSIALKLGVDAVEIDIRLTKDRQLVLMHDEDLMHCCGVNKKLRDLTYNQLKKIPTLSGEPIPTLQEALKVIKNRVVFLEPKDGDMYDELMHATANSQADIRYTTREHSLLAKIKNNHPNFKIYPTSDWVWYSVNRLINRMNASGISINYKFLNPLTYWLVRRHGAEMMIFTVDEPNEIEKAQKMFGDAWLCTNRPDLALEILSHKS